MSSAALPLALPSRRRFFGQLALAATMTTAALPLVGCDSNWITVAQQDIDPAVAIITTVGTIILTATGNGAIAVTVGPLVQPLVAAVHTGLDLLKQAIDDYSKSKSPSTLAKVDDVLTQVQGSVADLLSKIPMLPPDISKVVVSGMGILVSLLSSLQLVIPPSQASLAASPYRAVARASYKDAQPVPPTAKQIRGAFNSVLVLNGFADKQI